MAGRIFFLVNGHVYPQVDSAHTAARYLEAKLLFVNEKDGTFRNASKLVGDAIQIPQVSRGLAVGDLFNDGKMEAVFENLVGQPMILRPEGGPQNHWVSFSTGRRRQEQSSALNARVRATAGDLVQTDEILSGGSYLSQHDLRLHFRASATVSVSIMLKFLWPDGKKGSAHYLGRRRFM